MKPNAAIYNPLSIIPTTAGNCKYNINVSIHPPPKIDVAAGAKGITLLQYFAANPSFVGIRREDG